MKKQELVLYGKLLSDIKQRVRQGQQRAALSANATMILTYWDICQMIAQRQEAEGWGASVIPRLAVDLKNELPEEKGFSPRNLGNMVRFFREYGVPTILQHTAAKLTSPENAGDIARQKRMSFPPPKVAGTLRVPSAPASVRILTPHIPMAMALGVCLLLWRVYSNV